MATKLQFKVFTQLLFVFIYLNCHITSAADYVGSTTCKACHLSQFSAWQGSHHDMAMKHASSASVKGNFTGASIKSGRFGGRFFMNEDQYWINILAPNGSDQDFQIKYTFGIDPLQQYLVEFGDGRLQLIPFAWDNRKTEQGGQRWFHLYPDQTKVHQEFYWTNTGQNWNYMCADCHSTNVKKNFNLQQNTYSTTFSEVNVGCEACHGSASDHIDWAESLKDGSSQITDTENRGMGFNRNIKKQVSEWKAVPGKFTLQPDDIVLSQQTLVCAQCHSLHVQISNDDFVASNAFGDRYTLNLIDAQRYFPDGQVFDENYVYGSFLQSKMSRKGVVCSNCHEPHSAKLVMSEETVCLQCHQADHYATSSHHHHTASSKGAQCINCHMPVNTYMQIDSRRDHLWHIPRPELSEKNATPDVCLTCHDDKDNRWSKSIVKSWKTNTNLNTATFDKSKNNDFASVFTAIDRGDSQAVDVLSHIAQNKQNSAIIRASALQRMRSYPSKNSWIAIARNTESQDEYIRRGAIRGAESLPGAERWHLLEPLLDDKVLSVRTEAARVLAPLWPELSEKQQVRLDSALKDYFTVQDFNSDRGFSHTNKGIIYAFQSKLTEAESAYTNSIRIDPYYFPAYINLADLYRQQQREVEAIKLLQTAAQKIPDRGEIFLILGLAYIRNDENQKAIEVLKQSTLLDAGNSYNHYIYGLSLESSDPMKAQQAINQAFQLSGSPEHLYVLCELKIRHNAPDIKKCLNTLKSVVPPRIIQSLESQL